MTKAKPTGCIWRIIKGTKRRVTGGFEHGHTAIRFLIREDGTIDRDMYALELFHTDIDALRKHVADKQCERYTELETEHVEEWYGPLHVRKKTIPFAEYVEREIEKANEEAGLKLPPDRIPDVPTE